MVKKKQKSQKNRINVNITKPIEIKSENWIKGILNYKFLIPFVLSLIAIGISLNIHSPFDLESYSIGTYVIPANLSDNSYQVMTFILPIEFINTGAKPGVVIDIYLMVKHENIEVKYLPRYEIDVKQLHQDGLWDNQINKPFQQFGLDGEDRISKAIMFIGDLPGQIITTEIGNYSIEVFIKDSRENIFLKKIILPIKINEDVLKNIKNNDLVFIRSPKGYDSFTKNN